MPAPADAADPSPPLFNTLLNSAMAEHRNRVVLVRHGETAWSRQGRHTGRSDIPLTDAGREQARHAAMALGGFAFAAVFTSPLQRARDTCALLGLDAGAQVLDALREWDYGDYEAQTTSEIRHRRPGWFLWRDGVPNGETVAEVGHRADSVIATARAVDGDVALVAHGHILRVLAARWLGLGADAGRLFVLSTATISVLGYERDTAAMLTWNDGSHLG